MTTKTLRQTSKTKPNKADTTQLSLAALRNETEQLRSFTRTQLKQLWQQHFSRQSIPVTPGLLRQQLAFNAQAAKGGGLSHDTQTRIVRAIRQFENRTASALDKPLPALTVPRPARRQLDDGAVLIRRWRGRDYTVQVKGKRYWYHDTEYRSLTQIAKEITGAHWSGPRFFGLKQTTA